MSKLVAQLPVNAQPTTLGSMDLYRDYHAVPMDEKRVHNHQHHDGQQQCSDGDECEASHKGCHGARTRRILLPLFFAFLALGAIFAVSCWGGGDLFGMGLDGLARRATGDTTQDSPFVKNKRTLPDSIAASGPCTDGFVSLPYRNPRGASSSRHPRCDAQRVVLQR